MSKRSGDDGLVLSFIGGLIAGALVSAPVAAWLSPRRGADTRDEIRQRGIIIRRKAVTAVRKPIELAGDTAGKLQDQVSGAVDKVQDQVSGAVDKVQDQIGELQDRVKGESIEDSLEEGKAIAAQKRQTLVS
ncbi:YtxH domain-containing protein [Aggregatilinea lenta]|uniref:YtxH domain-containing protein n=1 Tax=Aggregatilinea lenta TaxID=913108 RepID=UPI000E5A8F95|nr:YtxH domain-containing protein [Aggregatilinea lenta]